MGVGADVPDLTTSQTTEDRKGTGLSGLRDLHKVGLDEPRKNARSLLRV